MEKPFVYYTCCVDCGNGEAINNMTDTALDITEKTFFKYVSRSEVQAMLGYNREFPISKDWHVSYHKGVYKDIPCYYLVWSGIEYIFTKG